MILRVFSANVKAPVAAVQLPTDDQDHAPRLVLGNLVTQIRQKCALVLRFIITLAKLNIAFCDQFTPRRPEMLPMHRYDVKIAYGKSRDTASHTTLGLSGRTEDEAKAKAHQTYSRHPYFVILAVTKTS